MDLLASGAGGTEQQPTPGGWLGVRSCAVHNHGGNVPALCHHCGRAGQSASMASVRVCACACVFAYACVHGITGALN